MASSDSGSDVSATSQTAITPAVGVPAHFLLGQDAMNLTLPPLPPRRSPAETRRLHDATNDPDHGVWVNVGEIPAGKGSWAWLSEDDRLAAEDVGIELPSEVETSRLAGYFTADMTERAGPFTVWFPDMNFFNPRNQPDGEGVWEFHLQADRHHASINFGGQAQYGLANIPAPSAALIWRIRDINLQEDGPDNTDGINLVWIPAGSEPPNIIAPPNTIAPSTTIEPLELTEEEGHGANQIDPNSGERHAPTNRGENNQTGSATANYHTNVFGGTPYTLDRSRAHATIVEPHKTWIVTNKGVWQQWTGAKTLDWFNKNEVEKLNKWKEQALTRHDWPPKRSIVRPKYTDDQNVWLMDRVKEERRTGRTLSNEQETLDFNATFNETRSVTGITAALHRMRQRLNAQLAAQEESDAPTS
ncbi:hypothetical protein LTR17_021277 [Elasticomyces elasticus]|nr:hypothetical protein LTR17_021277 [Elasticomyces elasticus]